MATSTAVSSAAVATMIPFETIEQAESAFNGNRYEERYPAVVVIADLADISAVADKISDRALQSLRQLDFSKNLAIAVFQGTRGTTNHSVTIQQIARQGDTLTINSAFTQPEPGHVAGAETTSPYHVVFFGRVGLEGEFRVVLNVDNVITIKQLIQ